MIYKQVERWAAAALAAAVLGLSACGADAGPVAGPGAPSESVPVESSPLQSEPPDAESAQPEHQPPDRIQSEPAQPSTPSPAPTPEPEPEPEPITGLVPLGEPVEEEWFADAVFLGDSRTDGLMLYSGIKSASFLSHKGLSVFNLGTKECISVDGRELTVLDALSEGEYAKVYLMLGINELGYPSSSFKTAYQEIVAQIKQAQPNATVYLQTIVPVNETVGKAKGMSPYITNEKVVAFNEAIAQIAEEENVALVDVAEAFWTEEGCIAADNTSDGVHLSRQGYVTWFEYLKSHTGTTEPAEAPAAFTPAGEDPQSVPGGEEVQPPDGSAPPQESGEVSPPASEPPAAQETIQAGE